MKSLLLAIGSFFLVYVLSAQPADTHGVFLAMLSVRDTLGVRWREAAPERFWIGPSFPCFEGRYPDAEPCFESDAGWPNLARLRGQYESGRMRIMGEMFYVYYGILPSDERLEPYWALAAELDIPVGVHIGRRPRATLTTGCCPHYNDDYGNPALLVPVLQRHPDVRIWLMHAGGRAFFDETISLMQSHPDVFAEMSIVNSRVPEEAHAEGLRALQAAGLLDRIMFGSDNAPLGGIVQRIEALSFLTPDQRRAISCSNAARFLRLDERVLFRSSACR